MIQLSELYITQSIAKKRLVYKKTWSYYFDKVAVFLFSLALFLTGLVVEIQIPTDGLFTGFLTKLIAPIFIILGIYIFYRVFSENTLQTLETKLPLNENEKVLQIFLSSFNYKVYAQSSNIIIVIDEHMLSYNALWRKEYFFLIQDYSISFTVKKLYPIISPPVLFSHLVLKRDLKKFFSNRGSIL